MKKNKTIYERISNNMSYLDGQITKTYKEFEDNYSKLFSQAEPIDREGNLVVEMIEGQFTMNCSKSEMEDMAKVVKNNVNYMNQCIDELEKVTNDMPKDTTYTDDEIKNFVAKVAALNSVKNNPTIQKSDKYTTRDKEENNSSDLPKRIVDEGRKLIGTPYVWGGSDPKKHGGVDCSGFVCYSAKQAGYKIGRENTKTLIKMGKEVKRADLQIGDLIFPKSSHVGFYSGNGKFLHSPKPGDKVKEVNIYGFWRGRRIFPGKGGDSSTTPGGGGGGSGGDPSLDSYYGPGDTLQLIERTPDPEISKVIVPQGAASWSTMASYLGTSESTLKSLNPGVKTLYPGTALYIPTTSVTQARALAEKARKQASSASYSLDDTMGLFGDNMRLISEEGDESSSNSRAPSSTVVENTPFQSFLKNEDYIKTYDLKEHKHKQRAKIEIKYDGKIRRIQTLISPISFSETYSNAINVNQTAGGWFISRHGENLPQLNISGYLLDTKYAPEKHAFMNEFKKYMTDTINKSTGDYESNAIIKIVMEGVEYQGHVTSVSFNKDASRPTLYTFQLNFTCIYYKNIRDVQGAVNNLAPKSKGNSENAIYLADGLASIINGD